MGIRVYLLFFLCIAFSVQALLSEKEEPVFVRNTKGLILVSSKDQLQSKRKLQEFRGFETVGLQVPSATKEIEVFFEENYLGKNLTASDIAAIKEQIGVSYKKAYYPFVRVEVPPQEVTSGILQLIVLESRLAAIEVQGGRPADQQFLKRTVDLPLNSPINERSLSTSLNFLNYNPFRRVDAILAPGKGPGTTAIILELEDRRPVRFYSGIDNTGVAATKRTRFFAGFNGNWTYGNVDQLLSYQYSASYNFHTFQAHTAEYTILLPWKNIFKAYGGAAFVHPHIPFPSAINSGSSYQASGRYIVPLRDENNFAQELTAGFDFKRTNNTFLVEEANYNAGTLVNIGQFMGGYQCRYRSSSSLITCLAELFFSPGQMFSDQTNADFQALQPESKNRYVYGLVRTTYLQRLPYSMAFFASVRGEASNQVLLPSEELGIGGYDTVRGYEERQINKDEAFIVNLEFRSPPLPIARKWKKGKAANDALEFLAFFDVGGGCYYKAIPSSPDFEYLMGIGPGARYTFDPYLTCRLDWGFKLHQKAAYGGGSNMIHFSVIGSF